MRKIGIILLVGIGSSLFAQNLELSHAKDIRQPGKLNPALTGVQEDAFRFISDTELGQSYEVMVEGKLPFKLGNLMLGMERVYTDEVGNNMFNITYAKASKDKKKKFQFRYGGSLQFNQKSILTPGYDSASSRYQFKDLNGEVQEVKTLDEIRNGVDYMDAEFGVNMTYKNLLLGASIENFLGQDVSLSKLETRTKPFTANLMLGGFLSIGEKITLFPSVVAVSDGTDYYSKAGIDLSTEKLTLGASYILEQDIQDISASIAIKYKKIFAGVRYNHPLVSSNNINTLPSFNLFFNTGLFKSRDLFKSDFAKQMRKFY